MNTANAVVNIGIREQFELKREHRNAVDRNAIDRNAIAVEAAGQRRHLAREHVRVLALLMDLKEGPQVWAVLAVRPYSTPAVSDIETRDAVLVQPVTEGLRRRDLRAAVIEW